MKEIRIDLKKDLSLDEAEEIAKEIASKEGNAMLLSFFDPKTDCKYPDVDCCGERSWEVYALSRGGNLRVVINRYEFIFRVD